MQISSVDEMGLNLREFCLRVLFKGAMHVDRIPPVILDSGENT